jgi:hypothetical protein
VFQRTTDIESVRKLIDVDESEGSTDSRMERVALAFLVPVDMAYSSDFDTPAALVSWLGRLSPATLPLKAESITDLFSDLKGSFTPKVILVAPRKRGPDL